MRRINTKGLPAYIKGFFTVLAGIVFIIFPDAVSNVIGILFAIILIVLGITGAVDYIISIKEFKAAGYGKSVGAEIVLVYSVIVMILGIIFLIRPDFVLNILASVQELLLVDHARAVTGDICRRHRVHHRPVQRNKGHNNILRHHLHSERNRDSYLKP